MYMYMYMYVHYCACGERQAGLSKLVAYMYIVHVAVIVKCTYTVVILCKVFATVCLSFM